MYPDTIRFFSRETYNLPERIRVVKRFGPHPAGRIFFWDKTTLCYKTEDVPLVIWARAVYAAACFFGEA